jgi:hypothetical protein
MSKSLFARVFVAAGSIVTMVAVVGAGVKWY